MSINLKNWQIQAYSAWTNCNYKGIIESVTGSGKTFLGLKIIENFPKERILIIVPTVALLDQWYEKILQEFPHLINSIGKLGGGNSTVKQITIAVINSIRDKHLNFHILILDEAHRYLSESNIEVLKNGKFLRILALSATIKRADDKTYEAFGLKVIYKYTEKDAIANDDLNKYDLINIGVSMTEEELQKYSKAETTVKNLLPEFPNFDTVFKPPFSIKKALLRRAIMTRKTIVNNSYEKILEAVFLIDKHKNDRVIVFSEYQKTVDVISKLLIKYNIAHGIYHTGIKDRLHLLNRFKTKEFNILLTVKALDEGLDVPDCDIGIIIAGTKSSRQIIQRLGRILRKKDHNATLYQLYVKQSVDEKYIKTRLQNLKGYSSIQWI